MPQDHTIIEELPEEAPKALPAPDKKRPAPDAGKKDGNKKQKLETANKGTAAQQGKAAKQDTKQQPAKKDAKAPPTPNVKDTKDAKQANGGTYLASQHTLRA